MFTIDGMKQFLYEGILQMVPAERSLMIGLVALLALGALVKSCRHQVQVRPLPREHLPSVEEAPPAREEDR